MEAFEQLQELGSKQISSETHIPLMYIESMLNKEFDQFQKLQFFGFISILEREYKINLSGLKQEFLFARAEEEISSDTNLDITETGSKLLSEKIALLKNKKVMYGAVGIGIILLAVVLVSVIDFTSETQEKIEINNTAIDKAKKNLNIEPVHAANVEEMMKNNDVESAELGQDMQEADHTSEIVPSQQKATLDKTTETASNSLEPVSSSEPMMPLYLRIVPKGKLWLGIINAETHRRRVETITEPLVLDAEKSWLIVTGYGHLDMDCGDATQKYRKDSKLLFLYENGICQVIDEEEFKARNKGKLW